VLKRVRQPLIDISCRTGKPVFQRHRQTCPSQFYGRASLPHAGAYVALLPKNAGLKVDPARLPRLLTGDLQQAQRRTEASCRAEVRSRGEPFGSSFCRQAGRSECHSGLLPAAQCLLPAAL
jgi:hypothetical protein